MALARTRSSTLVALALAVGGCANAPGASEHAQASVSALTVSWLDSRTTLTVDAVVDPVACVGTDPGFSASGTITVNTSVLGVDMSVWVDGVQHSTQRVANGADFVNFVAPFMGDALVPNGAHAVDVCFSKVLSSGTSAIRACLPTFSYDLDCAAPPPDMTPPTVTAARSPAANAAGWNNTDVTVSFSCADADSGIASCSGPVTFSTEGANQSATGTAVDNNGNTASATLADINIDKTAPTVAFVGLRDYDISETVSVTCDISDALSGVETSNCSGASGDAASLGEGVHSVSASASDFAGNSASATGSFNITVSSDGMCELIRSHCNNAGVARSLCVKLRGAEDAHHGHHHDTARNRMRAFHNELRAQRGRHFDSGWFDSIDSLADALTDD